MRSKIKRAFVLSGGGSLGAAQVGMLKALSEANIEPDLLIGASVGALNAAYIATHSWPDSVKGLEDLWVSIKRHDVFPLDIPALVSAIMGRRNYLIDSAGLKKIISQNLAVNSFQECEIKLCVVVTEVLTGKSVVFSSGDMYYPLLASASIPGVFPPVEIDGIYYMDGGVSDNTPISKAFELGAKEIYVLTTSFGCDPKEIPTSAIGMFLHTSNLLVNQGFKRELEKLNNKGKIVVIPAPCGVTENSYDFSQTQRLIQESYELAQQILISNQNSKTLKSKFAGIL